MFHFDLVYNGAITRSALTKLNRNVWASQSISMLWAFVHPSP